MSNPARIPPAPDLPPAGTKLNPVSKQVDKHGCWRMLSDESAYVFKPVCDRLARPLTELPPCEKFNVVACRFGYPDFEQTHPAEYAALKRHFLAGKFPPLDPKEHFSPIVHGPMHTDSRWAKLKPEAREKFWPNYLGTLGNAKLWGQVADDEMREHWLAGDIDRSPGFMLMLCASGKSPHRRETTDPVTHADLELIKYCAVFESGDKRTIVYLSEFLRDSLTVEEIPQTPEHEKREGQIRAENMAIATKTEKIIEKKANVVTAETKLEEVRRQGQKEDARQRVVKAKKAPPWHRAGFKVIFRRKANGKTLEHTLAATFRALCQILSEQPAQRARFGKIESLLGDRVRKLETEDGRGEAELSWAGKKQLREILKRPEAEKLKEWGILKVEEKTGREKFLILSPPKPVK